MDIYDILEKAKELNASDIHITVGVPPTIRNSNGLSPIFPGALTAQYIQVLVKGLLTQEQLEVFNKVGEVDFSFDGGNIGRYRANIYRQSGKPAIALRYINSEPPTLEELGLPEVLRDLAKKRRGLVLVTGPTGSGKSTTLAAMVDYINNNSGEHIITIEDPVEYTHKHKNSIINQREIGSDTKSFANALRGALRQDPDIILVGEMRDLETIQTAISAAETGHLVLSTLHTTGAAKTIDRIIDVFPPHQQGQIRTQLASVLQGIVSQQLMPNKDKSGRVAGLEILINTPAVGNLIREGKIHQINTAIQTGKQSGMQLMDRALVDLFKQNKIDVETLKKYAIDFNSITNELGMGMM